MNTELSHWSLRILHCVALIQLVLIRKIDYNSFDFVSNPKKNYDDKVYLPCVAGDGVQIGSGLPFRLICRSPIRFAYKMGIQSEVDNLIYHYGSDVINERIENIKACYEKEIKRPGVLKYKPSVFLDIYLKKITNKE